MGECLLHGDWGEGITKVQEKKQTYHNIVILEAFCLDVVQDWMNGAPNETRTHSEKFNSLAC